jgi:type IX secretion system PorP/SprF family membrane protein
MVRYSFLILTVVLLSTIARAQDPQFSQYYSAPLYLNPGFTGITPQQRIVVNHRIQWPNLPQAFATYAASYDIFVEELRSGFGVIATRDKMGSAGWTTTTVNGLYSFKVKLSENLVFSPGISFGYGINGLDRTLLRLEDGLRYRDGQSVDPELNKLGNQSYFDFGSGLIFYNRNLWLGAAFHHMNQPNLSVLGDISRLPMKTSIHGGARIPLYRGPRTIAKISYLTPSFIYRQQGPAFKQLDVGINYHIDPVSVGFWYRGKPFEKTVINTIAQDAMIMQLGLYFKNLTVGYSYDFTVSELQTTAGGAHEISMIFEFTAKPVNRSIKRKYRLIPCPTFNSKEGFWN